MSKPDRNVQRIKPQRAVQRVLIPDYWLSSLETRQEYTRRQDDTDGQRDRRQDLTVAIGDDGDCWVRAGGGKLLRFRTFAGGGLSLRTRQALMVLAEAIRLDNEERPQQ
jgi:hypothetical protein